MAQPWLLGWLVLLALPTMAVVAVVMCRRGPGGTARLRQAAGSALLFGMLGPPLAGLLVGIPGVLTLDDAEPVQMLVFVVLMSYLPGLVPALVGGACMGLLRPMLGTPARVLVAALICGLASCAFGIGVLGLAATSLPMMGGLGAASGAAPEGVCWWRERRRRARAEA